MDIILCCLYLDDNLIAVGSRDGSLLFYDRNGNIVKAHQSIHKSPVCTLAIVNDGQFLASGSDHPHPEIILWNLRSYEFEPYCKFKEHKGAVTAIECLRDNDHIISGSYDKRLCVYSICEKKIKYTLPNNKNSVTALTLNSNGSKLISCCL
jgi:WD40 repeat protein